MWKTKRFVHNITVCKVENSVEYVENSVERVDNSKKNRDYTLISIKTPLLISSDISRHVENSVEC